MCKTCYAALGNRETQNSQTFQSSFLSAKSPIPPAPSHPGGKQAKKALFLEVSHSSEQEATSLSIIPQKNWKNI